MQQILDDDSFETRDSLVTDERKEPKHRPSDKIQTKKELDEKLNKEAEVPSSLSTENGNCGELIVLKEKVYRVGEKLIFETSKRKEVEAQLEERLKSYESLRKDFDALNEKTNSVKQQLITAQNILNQSTEIEQENDVVKQETSAIVSPEAQRQLYHQQQKCKELEAENKELRQTIIFLIKKLKKMSSHNSSDELGNASSSPVVKNPVADSRIEMLSKEPDHRNTPFQKQLHQKSSPVTENVKLHKASNPWKPTHKVEDSQEINEGQEASELFFRRIRRIFSKLTNENFAALVEDVLALPIDSETRINGVIDLIFEKVVDEPIFNAVYVNLCNRLKMIEVTLDSNSNLKVNFKKLLLIKCQREFERDIHWEIEQLKLEDKEKAQLLEALKRRVIGTIRFIGELYKIDMLANNIMDYCLMKLLNHGDDFSMECFCILMTTIGEMLEKRITEQMVANYFEKIESIVQSRKTSQKVRFMLEDLLTLKKRNWIPRKGKQSELPERFNTNESIKAEVQRYQPPRNISQMKSAMKTDQHT